MDHVCRCCKMNHSCEHDLATQECNFTHCTVDELGKALPAITNYMALLEKLHLLMVKRVRIQSLLPLHSTTS